MARKNRLVVEDGLYHLTTRIAHQEHLLSDPTIKDKIVGWIYDIADFSGVNVCAWNVMDNHLHLYVHVPSVPEKYWLTPPEVGTVPPEAGPRVDADPATSAVKMGTAFGGLRLFPLRFNPGVGLAASARVPGCVENGDSPRLRRTHVLGSGPQLRFRVRNRNMTTVRGVNVLLFA